MNSSRQGMFAGIVFGAVCGLAIGAVISTKAAPKRQAVSALVQAQRLQVVDKDGTVRIDMAVEDDSASRIKLRDRYGKEGATLEVSAGGDTGLKLRDQDSKLRAQLAVTKDKSAVLTLADQNQNPCVVLATQPDGSQALTLLHTNAPRKSGVVILLTADGKSQINVYENGKAHPIRP
jgi:hypothetical protein